MAAYIVRRLLLIIPTLLGVMIINFALVQFAPGGPVEQILAEMSGQVSDATDRFAGSQLGEGGQQSSGSEGRGGSETGKYRGAQGVDPAIIAEIEKSFGFDKPWYERLGMMLVNYATFDFGESYFRDARVVDLVLDKLPVSISLGIWTTLITYLISIPLGIRKAVRDGSRFDVWTSGVITVGYAVPGFLFAILMIVLFAGGRFLDIFPLRGLVSDDWEQLGWGMRILDYFWHITLPVAAMAIGGFATLTMLTKNSFMDQINQQYVITARAKGLPEGRVLYGHVFRNAMLIVIAGFPAAFISVLFTSSLLIEMIFSLDGLGLLGYEAVLGRDYAVMFATLYVFTLLGLVLQLVGDITYTLVDPRIDFESRNG
jgi:microcin C transport system permease protein